MTMYCNPRVEQAQFTTALVRCYENHPAIPSAELSHAGLYQLFLRVAVPIAKLCARGSGF